MKTSVWSLQKHLYRDTEMCKNVLFSDESLTKQFYSWKYRVWRPPRARNIEKFITPTAKHPPRQMIWEPMSANGGAGLYFFPMKAKCMAPNT